MKAKQVIALVDMPGWTARVFDDSSIERSGAPDVQVTEADLSTIRESDRASKREQCVSDAVTFALSHRRSRR